MVDVLLERDAERAALFEAIAAGAAGRGRAVVIEGGPGIGKTALLRSIETAAVETGHRVLRSVGHRFEQDYPLGGFLQWFRPLPADAIASDPLDVVRHVLDEGRPPLGSDLPALLHGTYRLLEDLGAQASSRPVILLCDDAQWLDEPSLRVLHHVVAHVERLPMTVILTVRTGEPPSPLLDDIVANAATTVLEPAPLSAAAVGALVGGPGPLGDETAERLHQLTRGNPLLVDELRRSLGSVDPDSLRFDDIPGFLRSTTIARLERAPATDRHLATVAALLCRASVAEVAEVAGVSRVEAARSISRLRDLGILEVDDEVHFTHPLIREAVADLLAPTESEAIHEQAATVLDRVGASVDRIAPHLVAARPRGDERTAELLHRAAKRAWSSGTPTVAHAWLRRALAEPPAAHDRHRISVDLVRTAASLGAPGWREDLEELLSRTPDGRRWQVQLAVGKSLRNAGRLSEGIALFRHARRSVPERDRIGALEVLTELAMATRTHVPVDLGPTEELLALVDGPSLGSTPIERTLLGLTAYHLAVTEGPSPRVVDLASRSVSIDDLREETLRSNAALYYAVLALLFSDALPEARMVLDVAIPDAERRGAILQAAVLRNYCGVVDAETGNLGLALEKLRESSEVLAEARAASLPGAVSNLAIVLLELDRIDDASAALDLPGGEARWNESASFTSWIHSRSLVREASGDVSGALADALECGRRQAQMAATHPSSIPWRATAARLHLRMGDEAAARSIAEANLALCPPTGAASTRAGALRTMALLDRPADRPVTLRSALDVLVESPAVRTRVWTLVDLGIALRARGDRGRSQEVLRQAAELAERTSMTAAARVAGAELEVLGGRGRESPVSGPGALTASERRVAELAVAGTSNRDIAAQLYVSTKAVEFHLTNVYRKLGITSRADLPRALAS